MLENILKDKNYIMINDSYDYLLKLPIHTLTEESIEKLTNEEAEKKTLYNNLLEAKIEEIWINELEELFHAYKKDKKRINKE